MEIIIWIIKGMWIFWIIYKKNCSRLVRIHQTNSKKLRYYRFYWPKSFHIYPQLPGFFRNNRKKRHNFETRIYIPPTRNRGPCSKNNTELKLKQHQSYSNGYRNSLTITPKRFLKNRRKFKVIEKNDCQRSWTHKKRHSLDYEKVW